MNELIAKIKELNAALVADAECRLLKEIRQLELVLARLHWNWKKY